MSDSFCSCSNCDSSIDGFEFVDSMDSFGFEDRCRIAKTVQNAVIKTVDYPPSKGCCHLTEYYCISVWDFLAGRIFGFW